jgi:hypothetical protein
VEGLTVLPVGHQYCAKRIGRLPVGFPEFGLTKPWAKFHASDARAIARQKRILVEYGAKIRGEDVGYDVVRSLDVREKTLDEF